MFLINKLLSASLIASTALCLSGCFVWPFEDAESSETANDKREGTLFDPADTAGENGRLRFRYSSVESCMFGCGMGREVLAGSEVDVDVLMADSRVTYEVRSSSNEIAPMEITARCTGSDCRWTVKVDTKKSGDVKLEMVNTATNVVDDRITIKIRDASRVETTIQVTDPATPQNPQPKPRPVTPGPDGKIEVKIDSAISLTSTAFSLEGSSLLFMRGAFGIAYSNDRIVGQSTAFNLFGASATEDAQANTLGDAAVTISAGPAKKEVAFRVVR
jgi:hypothetical protein